MKEISNVFEDDEFVNADEIERALRFFWYVSDHWESYCSYCIDHNPEDFPIPPVVKEKEFSDSDSDDDNLPF